MDLCLHYRSISIYTDLIEFIYDNGNNDKNRRVIKLSLQASISDCKMIFVNKSKVFISTPIIIESLAFERLVKRHTLGAIWIRSGLRNLGIVKVRIFV